MSEALITVYGTTWCGQTRRALSCLEACGIPYRWVDIDRDPEGRRYVEGVNRGFRSVPTIVFPDGCILVEPTEAELRSKLGR